MSQLLYPAKVDRFHHSDVVPEKFLPVEAIEIFM